MISSKMNHQNAKSAPLLTTLHSTISHSALCNTPSSQFHQNFCTFVAPHIDSKLLLLLLIHGESFIPWSSCSSQGSSNICSIVGRWECQSVLSIALHNGGQLPAAPQRMALCLPRATPKGPVEMIGRFL